MDDLLRMAIDGHGGMRRWAQFSRFRARVSIGGAIWSISRMPGLLTGVTMEGDTCDQRLMIDPFPRRGLRTTWEPRRQTVETPEGVIVAERRDPTAAFLGSNRRSPWDEWQVAYFAAESSWNYLTAPFLFARDDFLAEESWPWLENGRVWRTLLVTYPETIAAHTREQTYYFDDAGLLRRLDYVVDLLGGGDAVHYPSRYRRFDGIMVPTRRRVHVRRPDGSPILEPVSVAVDVADITFW